MVHEYEQLKERNDALEQTNKKLNKNNEILIEENGVNRQLMLVISNPFHLPVYWSYALIQRAYT